MFAALVTLCACDKTIPASAMALVRIDRPGMLLYGGSILAGTWRGQQGAVGDVYEAIGAAAAGKITHSDPAGLEAGAGSPARARGGANTSQPKWEGQGRGGISPRGCHTHPTAGP